MYIFVSKYFSIQNYKFAKSQCFCTQIMALDIYCVLLMSSRGQKSIFHKLLLSLWMSFCSHLMMSAQKKRWFLFIANQSLSHDQKIYHYVYWIPGWSKCLQLWKFMTIISNNYEAYLLSLAIFSCCQQIKKNLCTKD